MHLINWVPQYTAMTFIALSKITSFLFALEVSGYWMDYVEELTLLPNNREVLLSTPELGIVKMADGIRVLRKSGHVLSRNFYAPNLGGPG